MKRTAMILWFVAIPVAAQEKPKPDAGTQMPTRQELNAPSSCALWSNTVPVNGKALPGQAYSLTLTRTKARFSGELPLTIEKGGVYSVAVDSAATVDIARGQEVAGTVSNTDADVCGNGTAFTLPPGNYIIRIRDASKPAFKLILIAK